MSDVPSHQQLEDALSAAGKAHEDYEEVILNGERDEMWPGFYTAYVLGRLGDFATASALAWALESVPNTEEWAAAAAAHVLENL